MTPSGNGIYRAKRFDIGGRAWIPVALKSDAGVGVVLQLIAQATAAAAGASRVPISRAETD